MWDRAIAGMVILVGAIYMALALRIPWGTVVQPGPGFFPVMVGVLLVASALGFGLLSIKVRGSPRQGLEPAARRRVIAVLAGLSGFCLLLPVAGYPIAAVIFLGVMLWQLGASWVAVTSIALASAGISYYLFAVVLGIPLPGGIFG